MGVGAEISTAAAQETKLLRTEAEDVFFNRSEDIVSANGNIR